MNLRTQAEADLKDILEDDVFGFGYAITIKSPSGLETAMIGFSNDIGTAIDVDTGQYVAGRTISAVLRLSSLAAAGYTEIPRNISTSVSLPWVVKFTDINGNAFTFKVVSSQPDRALGITVMTLELYKELT